MKAILKNGYWVLSNEQSPRSMYTSFGACFQKWTIICFATNDQYPTTDDENQ